VAFVRVAVCTNHPLLYRHAWLPPRLVRQLALLAASRRNRASPACALSAATYGLRVPLLMQCVHTLPRPVVVTCTPSCTPPPTAMRWSGLTYVDSPVSLVLVLPAGRAGGAARIVLGLLYALSTLVANDISRRRERVSQPGLASSQLEL
jgi:hypothetical protein